MKLGASRLNKMSHENGERCELAGYSETAFIMKECKDGSICKNTVTTALDLKGRRFELDRVKLNHKM